MPTISRAKRHKARIKRSNSLLKRGLREVMQRANQVAVQGNQNLVILITALAHAGGEITVPKALIDQVAGKLPTLGFAVVPGVDEGSFRIYVTDSATEEVLAGSLPPESLEEMKARMDRVRNGKVPDYQPNTSSVTAQLAADRAAASVDPTDATGDPA